MINGVGALEDQVSSDSGYRDAQTESDSSPATPMEGSAAVLEKA